MNAGRLNATVLKMEIAYGLSLDFTLTPSENKVIEGVTYYAVSNPEYGYLYTLTDYSSVEVGTTGITDTFYMYVEEEGAMSTEGMTVDSLTLYSKYSEEYVGPVEEKLTYTSGNLQILTPETEIVSVSAMKSAFDEVNTTLTYVKIPSTVTEIDNYAFFGCSTLARVSLPKTLTRIGNAAFMETQISSVRLSETLESVGPDAFFRTNLKSVKIPSKITVIPRQFLAQCGELESVSWSENLTEIEEHAFDKCEKLQHITLNEGLTKIGGQGFSNTGLIKVILPNSLTELGASAFFQCENLTSVTICDSITAIPERCFRLCSVLKEVSLPATLTAIQSFGFDSCNALKNINFRGTMAQWNTVTGKSNLSSATETITCSDGVITLN